MATPPSVPTPSKSRGHTLFDRQAQLHAHDSDKSSNNTAFDLPVPHIKPFHSGPTSATYFQYSPSVTHRQSSLISTNNNVHLIGVHPRSESVYIKIPTASSKTSEQLIETDFPLVENSTSKKIMPSDSLCCETIDQAFEYLKTTNDDDDDVIHSGDSAQHYDDPPYSTDNYYTEQNSDGNDSVDTIDLDATTSTNQQTDSGIHTFSLQTNNDKRHDSQEKLTENQSQMALSSRGTGSDDNDSDFDNQSHEDEIDNDDDQIIKQEEQKKQIILRQQRILWSIEQEWLRKEKSYIEQLEKIEPQLNFISVAINVVTIIQQLITHHKNVCKEIELFFEHDHRHINLTKQLTRATEVLMQTLPLYDDYVETNLLPIRKALEKRTSNSGMSNEDLLSILPKQFIQILSQIQDLCKTAHSFESDDPESLMKLHDFAHRCKLFGSRQNENINQIILKNEDVVIMTSRGNRDRCRLILYPDVIVCSNLKTKLLASPKYVLVWFIPMINLHWTSPQNSSDDNANVDHEIRSNLKSSYKELEKTSKSQIVSSRLSKTIRKQENEYNTAQSKLQLILSNYPLSSPTRSSVAFTILFSSAYQLQDWIDLLNKTQQELVQRSSISSDSKNPQNQRLTESLIQKRLDLIKPNLQELNSNEPTTIKTYSGTLTITIHNIHGTALLKLIPPELLTKAENNFLYYVAVEIDSYNTFYSHMNTRKCLMEQQDTVEFRNETSDIELEHATAFRLIVYRTDIKTSDDSQTRQCIGKFHQSIETALRDCGRSRNSILSIESRTDDLKVRISLEYTKRAGTFKRRGSRRSQAVFGKPIVKLIATPNGCIEGIPRIIVKCTEMVEREGLEETGIYRVCCVTSDLQKLRHEFDRNYQRGEDLLATKNVHVAANLLKLFFRELPEPLFTTTFYKQFLNAVQLNDNDNQRVTLLKTLESLPSENRAILFYLLDHLIRVSMHSNVNMMHLENLAVVFGPTLMRPSELISTNYISGSNLRLNSVGNDPDYMSTELQGSMYQCQVVLACLKYRRDGILK